MKKLIPLVFLSSCYMSYTPEDKVTEEATADSYTVIETDSATAEADSSEQIEVVDIDSSVVDIEIISKLEAEAKAVASATTTEKKLEDSFLNPILFDVVPSQGCINKDTEIYLVGQDIHWDGSIKIKYQLDTKFTTFDKQLRDECNRSIIDWYDLTMTSFRTRDDLIMNDEYGFIDGNYRIVVVNPDGKKSNEIGLNLSYCGDEVEEVKGCYGN